MSIFPLSFLMFKRFARQFPRLSGRDRIDEIGASDDREAKRQVVEPLGRLIAVRTPGTRWSKQAEVSISYRFGKPGVLK